METIDNLQKFGQSYQAKVVASLLESQPFLNQVSDITKKDFFELEADRWIVGEIVSYNLNNNSAPTLDVFKVKLSEVETDAQKKMIVDRLQQVYDLFGSPDSDFIKQEYLQFCKRQKLKSAIFINEGSIRPPAPPVMTSGIFSFKTCSAKVVLMPA